MTKPQNAALSYIMSDHLGGTWGIYDPSRPLDTNNPDHTFYFPYGESRPSTQTVPTGRLFTGQRLDASTGLYDYGARLYDPWFGRFISSDTIVPDPAKPQALNRYSYTANNPARYIDPSGHWPDTAVDVVSIGYDLYNIWQGGLTVESGTALAADVVGAFLPGVTGLGALALAASHADDMFDAARAFENAADTIGEIAAHGDEAASAASMSDEVAETAEVGRRFGTYAEPTPAPSGHQIHHLTSQRFMRGLNDEFSASRTANDIQCEVVTTDEHVRITAWRKESGYSNSSKDVTTMSFTAEDIRRGFDRIYADDPERRARAHWDLDNWEKGL